jgi:hypothetical protein
MDPAKRLITTLPLRELWDDRGNVSAERIRDLGREDVRQLSRGGIEPRFVVADIGQPLVWVDREHRYNVWKDEVAPRLVEPSDADMGFALDDFPEGRAYLVSEWRLADGSTAIVAEAAH